MNSVVDSLMPMQADIYIQQDEQDPNTGAIKKNWNYSRTVACSAKGIISNSGSGRSGDKQNFSNRYANEQTIEIRTNLQINYREKINNIRDLQGNVIWKELDYPTETPTVFEVISSTPLTDPFGNVLAYNSLAKRSENQEIGL
jgi:hypothetical protein